MTFQKSRNLRFDYCMALAVVTALGACESASAQDWPQWRGPQGQGTTSVKGLPPAVGSKSLKVLWKTPIPGEGCSSPIVNQGRIYLTTAYEGTETHAWDQPAFWAITVLACVVAGLALTQIPRAWQSFTPHTTLMAALVSWTAFVIVLTTVVLAKPLWFWQFADPWTGTTVAAAELPWVEALPLRPVIVALCGSLMLIFTALAPPVLAGWLRFVTIFVTVACGLTFGLIAWQPDWFFSSSQPWLAWLVTSGLALFALAGSIGWLGEERKPRRALKMIVVCAAIALAWWLFDNTPGDEFGQSLSLQNRIVYLVPGLILLVGHVVGINLTCGRSSTLKPASNGARLAMLLFPLMAMLSVILFARSNYLQPQTGVVRAILCLDAHSGEVLWSTPIFIAAAEKRHSLNSLATPTPACDGERVYAYFGSALAALDTDGRLLWSRHDAEFAGYIRYGAGSSVVLASDRIIIYRDSEFMGHGDDIDDDVQAQTNRRPTALMAHDKKTGAELWSIAPPFSHDSYMTPLVWTRDDRLEVVIATWKTLAGFAVSDGSLRWKHSYPMQQVVPSLAVNGDCLFVSGGNVLPCPVTAVRAPAKEAPAQTIWFNRKTGGNIVSPVCWDGRLFSMSHAGVLTCRDAESGEIHYTQRLGSRFLASLVAGDGKLYAVDHEGTLHVLAADTTGSVLATHSLNENCSATPAIAEGEIYVRTAGHLYRIGSGP